MKHANRPTPRALALKPVLLAGILAACAPRTVMVNINTGAVTRPDSTHGVVLLQMRGTSYTIPGLIGLEQVDPAHGNAPVDFAPLPVATTQPDGLQSLSLIPGDYAIVAFHQSLCFAPSTVKFHVDAGTFVHLGNFDSNAAVTALGGATQPNSSATPYTAWANAPIPASAADLAATRAMVAMAPMDGVTLTAAALEPVTFPPGAATLPNGCGVSFRTMRTSTYAVHEIGANDLVIDSPPAPGINPSVPNRSDPRNAFPHLDLTPVANWPGEFRLPLPDDAIYFDGTCHIVSRSAALATARASLNNSVQIGMASDGEGRDWGRPHIHFIRPFSSDAPFCSNAGGLLKLIQSLQHR